MVLSSGLTLTVNCDRILLVTMLREKKVVIMRKLTIAVLCVIGVFALSGCGDKVSLTNEQNDMIAEYVAGVLLEHSYDNEWKYTKLNSSRVANKVTGTTAATTPNTTGQKATTASSTKEATITASSLTEALGLSSVDVSYKNISIGDRYPTEAYAVCVPADSGCKVVAVEFTIKNTGTSVYTATTKSSGVSMNLKLGDGTYKQYKSMLKNDISSLDNISIKAGESYTAVAVFQVPAESAVKSSAMELDVLLGSQKVETIKLS